jgi:predicted  nucleic acid-binding Zn-ribbon protein
MTNQNEMDNEDWKEKYKALEKEYDDFREQSQSLERELEMDVEVLEKNNKELKSKNNQLQFDLDTSRVCTQLD